MKLAALIRKSEQRKVATAIPAIPATQPNGEAATVARIATVAVANPTEAQTATVSRWWLIHYPDGAPVEVWTSPPATYAQIMASRPDAVAAEPFINEAFEERAAIMEYDGGLSGEEAECQAMAIVGRTTP